MIECIGIVKGNKALLVFRSQSKPLSQFLGRRSIVNWTWALFSLGLDRQGVATPRKAGAYLHVTVGLTFDIFSFVVSHVCRYNNGHCT
jgi:hypothetical protein